MNQIMYESCTNMYNTTHWWCRHLYDSVLWEEPIIQHAGLPFRIKWRARSYCDILRNAEAMITLLHQAGVDRNGKYSACFENLHYYTGIFQGKVKNFPAVQPRIFGALQRSTITFRVRRTEAWLRQPRSWAHAHSNSALFSPCRPVGPHLETARLKIAPVHLTETQFVLILRF